MTGPGGVEALARQTENPAALVGQPGALEFGVVGSELLGDFHDVGTGALPHGLDAIQSAGLGRVALR